MRGVSKKVWSVLKMAVTKAAFVSSIVIVLFVALPFYQVKFQGDLQKVLDGLLYQEGRYKVNREKRVAVGFGSCWDLMTNAIALMNESNITPPQSPKHFDVVSSKRDLAQLFAYFFQNGAAAERFSNNTEFFDMLVSTANRNINVSQWSIGGNAPVISQRLAIEGWNVLLAAKMSPETAQSIHQSIRLSVETNSKIKEDIHLVMEYDLASKWGQYKSPRANRFILHNDYSNMMLESLEGFGTAIRKFRPNLVIIGGLQMLDNFCYDPKIRTKKLQKIQNLLKSLPTSVKVHFEMASFTDEMLLRELLEYVIPYADSLGMNEQELANIYSLLKDGNITVVSDYSPRIATSLDQGRGIHKALTSSRKVSLNHRLLTRIHIHTLAYQAIFSITNSGWIHSRTATAKASLMANRHVCASHKVNLKSAKLLMDESFSVSTTPGSAKMPLLEDEPVTCWYEQNMKICVAPNIVCTSIYKTASAGDNISAAGLSVQL